VPSISLPTAALIATGITAGAAAYESHQQGVATADAAKRKARVEAEDATAKQITMRQNMLRALASQRAASLGAISTGANTSFGANVKRQLTEGQNDLLINSANSSAQISLLDAQARNARSAGDIGAVADIAGGIGKMTGA
jgi:hypothetical protein